MPKEVNEETCLKWSKDEVKYLKAFYSTATVANATETWKRKSVSIISPKSGRISIRRKSSVKDQNVSNRESGFFARLFEDFKKAKVSDYAYQPSRVRKNSSYKPFWATRVVKPVNEDENQKDAIEFSVKKVAYKERNNASVKRGFIFGKGSKTGNNTQGKPSPARKLSTVEVCKEYSLRMPPYYNGSKMFMPTGERLFWVRYQFYLYGLYLISHFVGNLYDSVAI